MLRKLPKLIFTDTHIDAYTGIILTKISPRLSQLGYEIYFSETPEGKNIEDHISHINFEGLVASQLPDSNDKEYMLLKSTADLNLKVFLEQLEENIITYKAIDLAWLDDDANRHYATSEMGVQKRDQQFVKSYLGEKKAVFGSIGFKHAIGMQKLILEELELSTATSIFQFIHVFKDNAIDIDEINLRTNNPQDYPLGILCIDGNIKTEDEVIDEILKVIAIKQLQLDSNQKTSHLLSDSIAPSFRNDYSLFQQKKVLYSILEQKELKTIYTSLKNDIEKISSANKKENVKLLDNNIEYLSDIALLIDYLIDYDILTNENYKQILLHAKQLALINPIVESIVEGDRSRRIITQEIFTALMCRINHLDDIYSDLHEHGYSNIKDIIYNYEMDKSNQSYSLNNFG